MTKKRRLYIRSSPSSREDIIRFARFYVVDGRSIDIPDGIMLFNRMAAQRRNELIEDRRRLDMKIDICEKNIDTSERLLRDIKRGIFKDEWRINKE